MVYQIAASLTGRDDPDRKALRKANHADNSTPSSRQGNLDPRVIQAEKSA